MTTVVIHLILISTFELNQETDIMFRKAFVVCMILWGVISFSLPVLAQNPVCDEAVLRANLSRVIEEGFNHGQFAVVDELFAEDYLKHPAEDDREGFKALIGALRAAMPEGQASVEQVVVQDCDFFFVFHFSGIFENELAFPGQDALPATGNPLALETHVYLHINEQGQVAEEWDYQDQFSLLVQAGVIPMDASSDEVAASPTEETPTEMVITTSGDEARNAEMIERSYEDGNSNADLDLLRSSYAPDYIGHSVDGSIDGLESFLTNITALHTAIPDLNFSVNQTIAQGNYVAARMTVTGTFENELILNGQDAIPPTGQPIMLEMSFIHRLNDDGQIAEDWEIYDQLSLFAQLGLL